MKTNTKLFVASLISVLMSCQAYNYGTNAEPVQKSNLTFGMVKSKIVKNETSQDEIIKLFGSPNLITKNKSNNEVWSYNKMSVQNKAGSTGPLFGTNRASESSSSQSFDLIVTFDSTDKVLDYSVISTSY